MILFTIASREMAERKLVWAAAGWVGFMEVVLPWAKGLMGRDAGMATVLPVAFILVVALTLAAVLGAAMIPSDLANKRMGFYLARPVPMAALVGGRFLGAWLLAAGGGALVALVQTALHPRELGQWSEVAGLAALLALPVLLLFHYFGVLMRARSAWVLLDLAAMTAFLWAMAWMAGRLTAAGAWDALPWLLGGALTTVPLVLAGGAYLQMERGRADLRRGHRTLSMTVAAGLLATALAGLGFTAWVRGGGPSTLATFRVVGLAPKGDWLHLTGTGRMHPQFLLLDTATGETVAMGALGKFSGDGRHFVRAESEPGSSLVEVVDLDLGAAPAREKVRKTFPLGETSGQTYVWKVSEDGRFVLLRGYKAFLVVDLASGRKVCEEPLTPPVWEPRFCFPAAKVLRDYRPLAAGGTEIRDLDLEKGVWSVAGRILVKGAVRCAGATVLVADANGSPSKGLTACQGRTGAVTGRLEPAPGGTFDGLPQPRAGGTFAVVEHRGGEALLRTLDSAGLERDAQPLPGAPGTRYLLACESGTGRVFVSALPASETLPGKVLVADPARHTLAVACEAGRLPAEAWLPEGELTTRLLAAWGGGLSVRDPGGKYRTLLRNAHLSR